jgi:hypothetical protein
MKTKLIVNVQMVLGLGLIVGGLIIAVKAWSARNQERVFGQFGETTKSYKELFKTVESSSAAMVRQQDAWIKIGNDIDTRTTALGEIIRSSAEMADIRINPKLGQYEMKIMSVSIPVPKVDFEVFPPLHDQLIKLVSLGNDVVSTGKTIKTTIDTAVLGYAKIQKDLAESSRASVKMIEAVDESVKQAQNSNIPALAKTMRDMKGQIGGVSVWLSTEAFVLTVLGILGVLAGLVSIMNAIALVSMANNKQGE